MYVSCLLSCQNCIPFSVVLLVIPTDKMTWFNLDETYWATINGCSWFCFWSLRSFKWLTSITEKCRYYKNFHISEKKDYKLFNPVIFSWFFLETSYAIMQEGRPTHQQNQAPCLPNTPSPPPIDNCLYWYSAGRNTNALVPSSSILCLIPSPNLGPCSRG